MIIKKEKKKSYIIPILLFVVVTYFVLRLFSAVDNNGGEWSFKIVTEVLDTIYKITTPLVLTTKNIFISLICGCFALAIYEVYILDQKENIQKDTYGSAKWQDPSVLKDKKENDIQGNIILTETEQISKNARKHRLNRHITLIGRSGTGKSKSFFEPNILNATGGIICTDPKGELLRDTGNVLLKKGYDIKVLNLYDMSLSNHYNPFMYIRKSYKTIGDNEIDDWYKKDVQIKEDDVMTLINVLIKNTKSDQIDQTSGDPFWEKAEVLFLQALFYYIVEEYKDDPLHQNFKTVMKLLRKAKPSKQGTSELDEIFERFAKKHGEEHIAVKQWRHFKVTEASQKMMSTIVMTATSRLSVFNVKEVEDLVSTDDMELTRIGMPTDKEALKEANKRNPVKNKHGKVAYFIIIKPSNPTYNFIATIMYTQIFQVIDDNAEKLGGSLVTPFDMYLDEWAQMGEIPNFLEIQSYVRSLNVGIVVALQSLSQPKKFYKDTWETILDNSDCTILLGSNSKETLEYFVAMLGKKTWYKKSSGKTYSRQGSSSLNWDVVGRELAFIDELKNLGIGKCVLFISNIGAFCSNVYDIKTHPYYSYMYDSWEKEKTKKNLYVHNLSNNQTEDEKLMDKLLALGFSECKVLPIPTIKEITFNEITQLENRIYTPEELLASKKG